MAALERVITIVRQMLRVGAASFVALCVDVSIYTVMLAHFELAAPAAVVGHISGIVVHFAVSSLFFLRPEMADISGTTRQIAALAKFFLAGGCGLLVTTLVIYLTVDRMGLHPHAGKALAVGLSFLTVFSALKLFVLKEPRAAGRAAPDGAHHGAPGATTILEGKA